MNTPQQTINQYPLGSNARLSVIASMNLGPRSNAAMRALDKRARRQELMRYGMSFESACLVVNKECDEE